MTDATSDAVAEVDTGDIERRGLQIIFHRDISGMARQVYIVLWHLVRGDPGPVSVTLRELSDLVTARMDQDALHLGESRPARAIVSTVRRSLERLEKKRVLKRILGGNNQVWNIRILPFDSAVGQQVFDLKPMKAKTEPLEPATVTTRSNSSFEQPVRTDCSTYSGQASGNCFRQPLQTQDCTATAFAEVCEVTETVRPAANFEDSSRLEPKLLHGTIDIETRFQSPISHRQPVPIAHTPAHPPSSARPQNPCQRRPGVAGVLNRHDRVAEDFYKDSLAAGESTPPLDNGAGAAVPIQQCLVEALTHWEHFDLKARRRKKGDLMDRIRSTLADPECADAVVGKVADAVIEDRLDLSELEYCLGLVSTARRNGRITKSTGAYFNGLMQRRLGAKLLGGCK